MSESTFDHLIEISWRRKLTADEEIQLQAWLAGHPADAERWEAEAGLNSALERLEPVSISSNFARQVRQMAEAEAGRSARRKETSVFAAARAWFSRVPRIGVAWACVLLVAAGLGYRQYQESAHETREQVARAVQSISTVAAVTVPDVLEDFEAIREFSEAKVKVDQTDEALFVLLGQ